jgi:hypothetical protein
LQDGFITGTNNISSDTRVTVNENWIYHKIYLIIIILQFGGIICSTYSSLVTANVEIAYWMLLTGKLSVKKAVWPNSILNKNTKAMYRPLPSTLL